MKHASTLLAILASQAQAQIVYTDIVPDTVINLNGETYHLDLNNDGTADFDIYHYQALSCPAPCSSSGWVRPASIKIVDPLGANAWADTLLQPAELPPQRVIDDGLIWNNSLGTVASITTHCIATVCEPLMATGNWSDGISMDSLRYLGLRFSSGGATYYGWARLSMYSPFEHVLGYILKDYAYNSVPDEPILAGEGADISTGIAGITHSSVQISPNPFTSVLSVSSGAHSTGAVICTVRSLTGQVLVTRSFPLSSGHSPLSLDLASLASGIYVLDVLFDDQRVVRRLIKQ